MRVLTVVGARPQFIKAAPVSRALASVAEEILVHTGQHYDPEMSDAFFSELQLMPPTHNLGVGAGTHANQTARMLSALEELMLSEKPDGVLVYGDTNSTLAGALAAAKLNVPVGHVEAGLRSGDRTMPEEVNRIVADHLASVCYTPSNVATSNLHNEGLGSRAVEIGDVMVDSLMACAAALPPVPERVAALGWHPGEYLVVTLHRAATTDDVSRLGKAVALLEGLPLPTIFPLHPRTSAALERSGLRRRVESIPHITLVPPLGYVEMLGLVARARAVLTDSGGLQKEAYLLGTPCVTLRTTTEWTETLQDGWNTLVDLDLEAVLAAIDHPPVTERRPLYGDGRAAQRLAADLAVRWGGVPNAAG